MIRSCRSIVFINGDLRCQEQQQQTAGIHSTILPLYQILALRTDDKWITMSDRELSSTSKLFNNYATNIFTVIINA